MSGLPPAIPGINHRSAIRSQRSHVERPMCQPHTPTSATSWSQHRACTPPRKTPGCSPMSWRRPGWPLGAGSPTCAPAAVWWRSPPLRVHLDAQVHPIQQRSGQLAEVSPPRHRRRSGKVAYGAQARSCPGLAGCDGDRPGRRHRSTGTRQRISTWYGENARIQVRLRNRPLNAGAVVDGYWLAGLPSDQMRTHHLVRRFANLNEGRRHGQPYR